MKVLVISQYWYPENGVPQRRWSWLTEILEQNGNDVLVIAPPPHYERNNSLESWLSLFASDKEHGKTEKGPAGEQIVRCSYIPAGRSLTQRALNQAVVAVGAIVAVRRNKKIIGQFAPDLIVGTVPALPTAFATKMVARMIKRPYIIDLRDAWPDLLNTTEEWNRGLGTPSVREKMMRQFGLSRLTSFISYCLDYLLRDADGILVTSEFLKVDIENRLKGKAKKNVDRVGLVRNVFPVKSHRKAEDTRKQFKSNSLKVMYAGTLGRAQNLVNVLDALQILSDRGIDISVRFVGAGAAKENLISIAEARNLNVTFEPRVPADELDELYSWADTALVHLTNWEPLDRAVPSKLYELMELGLHVTAVASGETAAIVRELEAGEVVEPENPLALAELWSSLAADRNSLAVGNRGKEWVQIQRREIAPRSLLSLMEKVINEN